MEDKVTANMIDELRSENEELRAKLEKLEAAPCVSGDSSHVSPVD